MSRSARLVAAVVVIQVVVLVVVMVVPAGDSAGAGAPAGLAEKVLVLSVPGLGWESVVAEAPTALARLLERSALASLSVRTIGPGTTLGEGYATIGAGNRATIGEAVAGEAVAGEAVAGEAVEVGAGPGAGALERRCGCDLDGWAMVQPGIAGIVATNEALLYGAEPGALGTALAGAGRPTAVVTQAGASHEAVLALMESHGRVAAGSLGVGAGAVAQAFSEAWSVADVVLVEVSDLAGGGPLLGRVLAEVDLARHLVVVVAPVSAPPGPDQLTVAALAGAGFTPGLSTSASTRRPGYLTLPDLAPTVLGAFGVEPPASMTGTRVVPAGGAGAGASAAGERVASLAEANRRTVFRDRATGPVSVTFVVFQVVGYGLAALAGRRAGLRPVATAVALTTLAVPSLAFLSGLVAVDPLGVWGYVAALFAAAAALAAGAWAAAGPLGRRADRPRLPVRPLVAALLLAGATLVVLVVDVVSGGRLQLGTVFGYSATVAGRFAGYGNLAFALVAASAIVVVTGAWGLVRGLARGAAGDGSPEPAPRLALVAAGAAFAVVVVADGHPALGADVGGVLALVPAAVVVVTMLAGRRVTPRLAAAVAALAVAVAVAALAAFIAIDLARPPQARTHLARTAGALLGDGSALGPVVERKLRANLAILTSSAWVLVVPVVLAAAAYLLWRRPATLRRLEAQVPGLRAGLVGAVVAGALGGLLNDSGAAVPAMMMAVVLPYLTVLTMAEP